MLLLTRLLRAFIRAGTLSLIDAHGVEHKFGGAPGPSVAVRLHDKRLHTRLALNPELYAAEAYM
jgi:cyclopropane-fatty-acyl-phospholipid synthase